MRKRDREEQSGELDASHTSSSDSDGSDRKVQKLEKSKHESKKKKSKHKKKHKKDSEKELLKAAKKYLKKQLSGQDKGKSRAAGTGGQSSDHDEPSRAVDNPITTDDYFLKHTEFTTWLRDKRSLYFTDLTAEESRERFEEFVEAWNAGRLAGKYYSGILAAPTSRTSYKWAFAGSTESRGTVGMTAFLDDDEARKHQGHLDSRTELKAEQRRWNANQRVELDELLPRATGREAMVEKKLARREATRAREESPDAVPLPGGGRDIMGGGDSFEAARARESKRQEMRQHRMMAKAEEVQQRVAQYQAVEDAKMAQFKALVASGPISIPKRQPPPS